MEENEHIEDIDEVEEVEVHDLDDPEEVEVHDLDDPEEVEVIDLDDPEGVVEVIDLDDVEEVEEIDDLVQEIIDLDEVEDPPGQVSSGDERASALAAVLEHATHRGQVVVHHPSLPPERVAFSYVALAVSLSLAFWIWFFPPGWAQRNPVPYPSFAEEETSLRLVMFLQTQRIEAFRLENGHLPENLDEAGPPLPGMEYTPLAGQTYYLRGEGGQAYLGYFSSQAIEEFLGDSEDLLALEVDG